MNTQTDKCIDVCNSLLAGQISAVETYDIALKKFEGHPAASKLSDMRGDHAEAVSKLRTNIVSMGGEPREGSGAWGAATKTIQHAATLFGKESALESLQAGEKHGQEQYEDALADKDVMQDCKNLINEDLLPKVNDHIVTLERLEEQVG